MPTFGIYRGAAFSQRVVETTSVIKIGRDPRAKIVLAEDEDVARMHAVIEITDGAMLIIDLGSNAGTRVNGERTNKHALAAGDRIDIGSYTILVEADALKEITEPHMPTPERIRDIVGASFAPKEFFGVAAIVLHVDGIRREAWSHDAELGEALFATYPRGAIASPELGVARSFKTIDDSHDTRAQRCSMCVIRPGFAPCAICLGSGKGPTTEIGDRCIGCDGIGFLQCSACDGTTRVVQCAVRYVNDHVLRVRRALVPAVHPSLRPYLEARIPAEIVWPRVYAFDPEPTMAASAYRGSSASIRAAEDFHGYFFGDAIETCLTTRTDLVTGLARFDLRTFAIPVLWTVTNDKHEAYFFDPLGKLEHVA